MSRGSIWRADLDPVVGHEANKARLVMVVGRDAAARQAIANDGMVTVVPLTSKRLDRLYGFHVLVPASDAGIPVDSKAQAEQVRTVSVRRLITQVGQAPAHVTEAVDNALRFYLGL
ncbi:type II toxin-antitoxin system PemK/MazF family toxin [Demequina pelophila]|uniref:type II toxin-antitoxin system PemK/MazF family toxin n=1 Tax=Demequina pelophila TaxID=1638984 RepID=UPI000782B927|nr:type II toxin-antitoxin system PemK/MazF family toxin [Demequina pelophila]